MFENILMIAETAAPAAGKAANGAAQQQPEGGLLMMIPFLIIGFAFIYFINRTQKKQQKKQQEMLQAIKAGDKIITAGGIHGEITKVKESTFMVKVSDNLTMEFSKAGISRTLNEETKDKEEKK